MTAHDAFVTFGLPAIAVVGALLGLWITTRNANRLRGGPAKAEELGGEG